MWLITNFGFFSVVQKPGQRQTGMLTVRGRVRADLEALQARCLPTLGPIEVDTGTDYRYRAVAPAALVAAAMCRAVADIDYSNFKDSVGKHQGIAREGLYHKLWGTLHKLTDDGFVKLPTAAPLAAHADPAAITMFTTASAYGGVVIDDAGRILLRKPAGEFDGYVWTFPKGRPTPGESPQRVALREVREEAGVDAAIVAEIPGNFRGGTSYTSYYLMTPTRDHGDFDRSETQQVTWLAPAEARRFISQTRNEIGRQRDENVIDAALAVARRAKLARHMAEDEENDVLTGCALRFDGYSYANRAGLDLHAEVDRCVTTGTWPEQWEVQFAVFFMLQRQLLKEGRERDTTRSWWWFRELFLKLSGEQIPVGLRLEDRAQQWDRLYRPQLPDYTQQIRQIHDNTMYVEAEPGAAHRT